jgi:hypothetical protein
VIPLVVLFWAGLSTVVGVYGGCGSVARRFRLARYRRQWRLRTRPLDGDAR